jgi:hypothetical protein
MTTFISNAATPGVALAHFWERCVGSGHSSLALREEKGYFGAPISCQPRFGLAWSSAQVDILETASRLTVEKSPFSYANQDVSFDITLPPQSVAAISLEFGRKERSS